MAFINGRGFLHLGDATPFFDKIGNVIKGVWNDWTGNTANQANIDYQEKYNQEVFGRADTQYQRTVADLRAAGLSSQLAAGAPVTTAGQSQAPQRTVGNESASIASLVNMINSVKQTQASTTLASAQADNIKADTAIKRKEFEGFDTYRAMELSVMGSSASLNMAYTRLSQIDGQTRAAKNIADIQNTMMNTKYLNSLIDLCDKNVQLADSEINLNRSKLYTDTALRNKYRSETAYTNKSLQLLSEQIVTETFKQQNLAADTRYALQNATNAALKFTIDNFTFQFKKDRGDSPDSTEVSSTQSDEKKKEFKRDLIKQIVSSVGGVASGVGLAAGLSLFGLGQGGANRVKRKQWDFYRENF